MAPRFSPSLVGVLCGAVFALGLSLSGMTDPQRVLAFLDFFGSWDPSLAFVMAGAIGVHFTWLRFVAKSPEEVPPSGTAGAVDTPSGTAGAVDTPSGTAGAVDTSLLLGSAIFGVGWGMSGYCPGPALVAAALGRGEAWLFCAAMVVGMLLFAVVARRQGGLTSLRAPS